MTYNLFFEFPNNSHLPSRLERFSEQELKFSPRFVLNERVAGEKKNFFFEKLWPNTPSHKNSGGRICVRSREKCWQSTETLKKTSPFVYPSQRKHAKLKSCVFNSVNFALLFIIGGTVGMQRNWNSALRSLEGWRVSQNSIISNNLIKKYSLREQIYITAYFWRLVGGGEVRFQWWQILR